VIFVIFGYVYAKVADATADEKTAVAKITYVASETGVDGKTHGLALSLRFDFWSNFSVHLSLGRNHSDHRSDNTRPIYLWLFIMIFK
jgi:hypothetical protein